MCDDPKWNHHTGQPRDPNDRTQILEPPKGLKEFFNDE